MCQLNDLVCFFSTNSNKYKIDYLYCSSESVNQTQRQRKCVVLVIVINDCVCFSPFSFILRTFQLNHNSINNSKPNAQF